MRVCFDAIAAGYRVRLIQSARDRFTVEYGEQRNVGLTYPQAATELGACLMHAAACEGKLFDP